MRIQKPSVDDKIITDLDGKPISSLPKSKRKAARKAVKKQRKVGDVWKGSPIDQMEYRKQAEIASRSGIRRQPTRRADRKKGIDESRM